MKHDLNPKEAENLAEARRRGMPIVDVPAIDVSTCPTCNTRMTEKFWTKGPTPTDGKYWQCENQTCPDKSMQCLWPDAQEKHA